MFFKPSRFRQTNDHFKSGDTIALQAVYKADSLPCKKGLRLWEAGIRNLSANPLYLRTCDSNYFSTIFSLVLPTEYIYLFMHSMSVLLN